MERITSCQCESTFTGYQSTTITRESKRSKICKPTRTKLVGRRKSRCDNGKDQLTNHSCTTMKQTISQLVIDLDRPINTPTGYQVRDGYQDTVNKNLSEIADHERTGNDHKILNRQVNQTFSYRELENIVGELFREHNNGIQVNIGFGFILLNSTTNEFKYFFDSRNHMLYEHPRTINHEEDVSNFTREIASFDLAAKYYLNTTPSSWELAGFTNVEIKVTKEEYANPRNTTTNHVQLNFVSSTDLKSQSDAEKYLVVSIFTNDASNERINAQRGLLQALSNPCSEMIRCCDMDIL